MRIVHKVHDFFVAICWVHFIRLFILFLNNVVFCYKFITDVCHCSINCVVMPIVLEFPQLSIILSLRGWFFVFQVVWSSTTDVGCGISRCAQMAGFTNAQFVVCYYGPPCVFLCLWLPVQYKDPCMVGPKNRATTSDRLESTKPNENGSQ